MAGLQADDRGCHVELRRFGSTETAQLAERVANRRLADAERARLCEDTDGNPLFVIEAVRAGVGAAPLVPKVHAVIHARLAQLSQEATELAGAAATVGRTFTADLLSAATQMAEEPVVRALDELWRRGLAPPPSTPADGTRTRPGCGRHCCACRSPPRAGMLDAGMSDWLARNLVTMFGFVRQGAAAQATDVVRALTGREPRTLSQFLRDHADVFTG